MLPILQADRNDRIGILWKLLRTLGGIKSKTEHQYHPKGVLPGLAFTDSLKAQPWAKGNTQIC